VKKIVLTGGGTAGHVIPNLALAPALAGAGASVEYIGSAQGIEKRLVEEKGIPFHSIPSGKLRRYFDLRNFTDPFRVIAGLFKAWALLGRIRPALVFSKGGFVTVPVVMAARLRGIPAVLHESDMTPGLANRLAIPFATTVCASFRETLAHLPPGKAVHTGAPIRAELFRGDKARGLAFLGFAPGGLPVLLVMGGSLGSRALNRAVREALPALLARFRVAHICGKGGLDPAFAGRDGYRQLEYVGQEMADVLASADYALSRAGSNAIFELLALQIPHILVPLPLSASRGDQILNARAFAAQGYSRVLPEEEIAGDRLARELEALVAGAESHREAMRKSPERDGTAAVAAAILRAMK
jgi:UDP-N-acetylglucosamine--N-acetylmuramyl-(pentapeptide) pyrophosphoryl-undecaprenol N-acetylglucosamine transferase